MGHWPEAAPASGRDGAGGGKPAWGGATVAEKRPPLSAGDSGRCGLCRRHTSSGLAGPQGLFTQPLCDNLQVPTLPRAVGSGPAPERQADDSVNSPGSKSKPRGPQCGVPHPSTRHGRRGSGCGTRDLWPAGEVPVVWLSPPEAMLSPSVFFECVFLENHQPRKAWTVTRAVKTRGTNRKRTSKVRRRAAVSEQPAGRRTKRRREEAPPRGRRAGSGRPLHIPSGRGHQQIPRPLVLAPRPPFSEQSKQSPRILTQLASSFLRGDTRRACCASCHLLLNYTELSKTVIAATSYSSKYFATVMYKESERK